MPGRTWKDLRPASPSARRAAGAQQANGKDTLARARQMSPKLNHLLEEREGLEKKIKELSAGENHGLSSRDAARFQVPTFAERQTQQRLWEQTRERLQSKATELRRRQTRQPSSQQQSAKSSPQDNINQWLANRDRQRQDMREAARDRLSPLNDIARTGRQLGDSLAAPGRQLRDLDRQLKEQGMSQESDELQRSLGVERLSKTQSAIGKYTRMAEAPMKAVNKVDRFWKKRQQDIAGPMDRFGSYAENSKRRLSTERGGSGNLFERMERNRKRALLRRMEKRREEEKDEARRERAKRNRKAKEKEKS